MSETNYLSKLTALSAAMLLILSATVAVAFVGGTSAQQAGNAAVTFTDQTTAGSTVTVDSVTLPDGGFVVVHDSSLPDGNVVGSVIGVSGYLGPGTHDDVTVTLFDVPGATFNQTTLTEDQTLIAMAHIDTNGNQTYDFVVTDGAADGAYLANGSAVTDSATVTVEQQPTTSDSFVVTDLAAPSVVEKGSGVTVRATITNPSDTNASQQVEFRFDGEVLASEQISLGAGESIEWELSLNTSEIATGNHIHGVYTRAHGMPAQLLIVEEVQSFRVSNLSAPEAVAVGDNITVNATISNPNEFAHEQRVEYRFSGDLVGSRNVSLQAGASTTVEFSMNADERTAGTYIHSVFSREFGQSTLVTLESASTETPTGTPANTTTTETTTETPTQTATMGTETTTAG